MRRIPSIPDNWKAFGASVIVLLLLPGLPLLVEWGITYEIRGSSAQIFLAIYALALGASSRDQLNFILGVAIGVIFSAAYGYLLTVETIGGREVVGGFGGPVWRCVTIAFTAIVVISHLAERYNRHVYDGEPFLELTRRVL